eukprot:SAG25_NODE_8515_length_418_cov_0.489028_1_plen_58_part_10
MQRIETLAELTADNETLLISGIAVVRCHSSLFPWLAAVAVRNSANAICGVHVLKNITQ